MKQFVYMYRKCLDIDDRVWSGEFLSLSLIVMDAPDRTRNIHSYILTQFPIGVDPNFAKEHSGMYFVHCFIIGHDFIPLLLLYFYRWPR